MSSAHTGTLSDALQRVLRQAGARPPFHVLYKFPGAMLRSSFPSVTSSLCVPGLYRHRRWPAHSVAPSAHMGALSDALQRVFCQTRVRPPLNVLYKSPGAVLRTSVLVLQRYFLVVGAGHALTSPADRALRCAPRAHGRFIRCPAACSLPGWVETALQRPLQVPWGCAPCLISCSPSLLPRCGCRAGTDTAGEPCTPSRAQRTRALCPMHFSVFSARPGGDRPSTSYTSPLGPCSVPRSPVPGVTSSLWVLGPHRQRWRTAHPTAPSAHTGALSDALQRVLCQVRARPPFNVLLWQAPEPPARPCHHESPRPRRRPQAPQYWLQRGLPRSGIGLPLVPLDPWRPRIPTLQVDGP
ncbi:hypothetical protein NDU88_010530 [Pleurodeles waltl]|uniref:Uncharacterized protein n=1 Tax=Pleurodeles waltl TaxID=8319 RepID=A0AAV7QZ24_PLEWA|nr:hypothetical protein NDU88_010530 [Pleurodeles waltl]